MTYTISLLGVFQTGTLAEHIIGQDFSGSDIVRTSEVSKGFYNIITDPKRAATFYKRILLPFPFQFVPTTLFVRTKLASGAVTQNTHHVHLVPIGERHVLRGVESGQYQTTVHEAISKWFYVLMHGGLPQTNNFKLETDESYTFSAFQALCAQYQPILVLDTLMNHISFDALKSFLVLCLPDRLMNNTNFGDCEKWMREVAGFPAVQKDPVGCLYSYQKINEIFAVYDSDNISAEHNIKKQDFKTLRNTLMQLPGFNFDIFMRVCLQDDNGHTGMLDGIKYLRNFIRLYKAGHINFETWRVQYERDHRLSLSLSTMTDAFVRAVQKGHVSCDLTELADLFGLLPLLREETELDRNLNKIFEDLCAKLEQFPDLKSSMQVLNGLFDFIFMYSLPYNLEQDLREERGSLLFSQFWRDGEIRVEALYGHLMTIQNARKKAFDSFVSESETLKANPQLRAIFSEEPSLFAFYKDHFCLNRRFKDLFYDEEIMQMQGDDRPLAMFVQDIAQREARLIDEDFSPEVLQALSGLTALEIQKVLSEFKSSNPAVCTGLIGFQTAFLNSESVGVSEVFEASMLSLVNSLARLQPILKDKNFSIRLESFPCAVHLIDSGLGHDLIEQFSKIEIDQLRAHIVFLRESTLHLLCKFFGSRAATLYFEALSQGDRYVFVKALMMMSLGALTQDQWILSLRALIRSDYHRPSVKDEDGNMIYNNSLFLGNIRNYIEAVFDAFASKGEIDHDVLLKKVLTPELSF
ncbi:MAG: hypothetical protein KBF71_05470 [Alphaproteobacteria bacterium]|nr:hypothetical protein [Alphaproteobacteria bacterium]